MDRGTRTRGGRRAPGFTLVELLVCIAIIIVLVSILMPSLDAVREQVQLIRCASQMHGVGASLLLYATQSDMSLPPFAFSDTTMDVVLSGHWGGTGEDSNRDLLGQKFVNQVNLQVLEALKYTQPGRLICPGAGEELASGKASYFGSTKQFSTYCLRMPVSEDLFSDCRVYWKPRGLGPLGAFAHTSGGYPVTATYKELLPQVRLDMKYTLLSELRYEQEDFEPARDVLLSDAFWYQGSSADHRGRAVQRAWCHGKRFEVMRGDGSVQRVEDDGTIREHVNTPGGKLDNDQLHFASYSEHVWQYMSRRK